MRGWLTGEKSPVEEAVVCCLYLGHGVHFHHNHYSLPPCPRCPPCTCEVSRPSTGDVQ